MTTSKALFFGFIIWAISRLAVVLIDWHYRVVEMKERQKQSRMMIEAVKETQLKALEMVQEFQLEAMKIGVLHE